MKIYQHQIKFKKAIEETHYGKYTLSIIDNKNVKDFSFRLYCKLFNSKKGYSTSIPALAKLFGVDTNKIDRAITNLKECGYLESSGDRTSTVWNVYQQPKQCKNNDNTNPTSEVN